jgi:LPXTG-motif cell wall-anchored protein
LEITREEEISNIPTNNTYVQKNPSAADILDGAAAEDGNDTTGGTTRMDDRNPTDIVDNPTERETATAKTTGIVIIIGIVLLILGAVFFVRRKR